MKLILQLFDLETDRIIKPISHYLLLEDEHFVYHAEAHLEKVPGEDEVNQEPLAEYLVTMGPCCEVL